MLNRSLQGAAAGSGEPPRSRFRATAPTPESRSRKVLNFPLLIGTLAALAAVGTGLHFWRDYKVRQNAFAIRTRAESLADEHDLAAATAKYSE